MPVFLLAAGAAIAAGGDGLRTVLRFDRAAIAENEVYRLMTGHLAHLGWSHLALNGLGLILCWILVGGAYSALEWIIVMLVCIAVIDAGFWLLLPDLAWYVGLSGLLHGILAAGAVGSLRRQAVESGVLLGLLAVKIGYELVAGPMPGSAAASGGPVVIEAHFFGAVGGLAGAAAVSIGNRWRASI